MKLKLYLVFYLFPILVFSQLNEKKRINFKNETLSTVLFKLENIYDVKFSYLDSTIREKRVHIDKSDYSLREVLNILKKQTSLIYKKIDSHYYAVYSNNSNDFYKSSEKVLANVIIHAYLAKGISKNKDNSFRIRPQELGILPGVTEPDVLQTLQQLPGVLSLNETVTGIYVRGGTPDQNLILWDDIPMYHNGHMFGMISGYNSNINQTIHFINKGTNPKYGGKIASVIDIHTSDKIPKKSKVSAGFNLISIDANANLPIIKDKLKIQVSGRRSFTDFIPTITLNRLSQTVFQNTKIARPDTDNIFYFRDYNIKLNYKLSGETSLAISNIWIDNNLDNFYPDTENKIYYNDLMKINNKGYSAVLRTKKNLTNYSLKTFYSYYDLKYDYLIFKNEDINQDEKFTKKNIVVDSGISLDIEHFLNPSLKWQMGYQYLAQDVSHTFISITPALEFVLDSNAAFLQTHSFYSSLHFSRNKFATLNFGGRVNYITGIDKFLVEPRLNFNYKITDYLKLNTTAEVKNQIISQIQETVVSSLNIENQLWVLANQKRYPIINVKHYSAGLIYKKNRWTIDLDTYIKHEKGLTTLTFGFFNSIDPVYHVGESSIIGSDLYVEKDFKKLRTWITYSFNSSMSKFEGINEGISFPSNKEVKFAVNIGASYQLNNWQLALGWNWHTGKPFTIIDETDVNTMDELTNINEENLPSYHRLDISTLYKIKFQRKRKTTAKIGVSLYNLYNRKNLLSKEYYFDTMFDSDVHIRERYSLQFTPNMFFRVQF